MKKLDNVDKRLLFELDKNARIPETHLAKMVGKSKESVRYRIKKLQEQGIIQGFSIWIDPVRIGYKPAKFYLNIANIPEKKEELINYVKKDKRLFWLGVAEGAWNIGLTFFVKSNKEFFELKKELSTKFGDLILESYNAVPVGVYVCDRNFFHKTETEWTILFGTEENHQLEDIDKKILKDLFLNSRMSVVEIAKKHQSTVDIVRNHIKKLEEKKIIFRYRVNTDHNLLGYEFFKTFLYFNNLTKNDEMRLIEYAKSEPSIIHFLKQISPWEIELEVMSESYLEYNQLIQRLTKEFAKSIKKVETAIMSEDYVFPAEQMVFE
jgi:DNA-binding Lrp family transcriptional regulator